MAAVWRSPLLGLGCRYVLAAVFLMAAVTKLTDPSDFEHRILLHSDLSEEVGEAVVAFLPWLELTCGLCLALGYAVREAALLTGVLLLLFSAYALVHPTEPDCGCFVFVAPLPPTPWWHLLRNLSFLACSARVIWPATNSLAKPPPLR